MRFNKDKFSARDWIGIIFLTSVVVFLVTRKSILCVPGSVQTVTKFSEVLFVLMIFWRCVSYYVFALYFPLPTKSWQRDICSEYRFCKCALAASLIRVPLSPSLAISPRGAAKKKTLYCWDSVKICRRKIWEVFLFFLLRCFPSE